ncbi:MAG: hypothetical protein LBB65_03000, partial [Burkholderiales bacterium]|nr:hypothetical protein [Burkholderiales bacterium]
ETQSASTFATLKKYAPTLCAEIDAEGYPNDATRVAALRELARSVLDNHEPYLVFLMAVQAQSKHHRDAIDAADNKGALLTYDWRAGWPEINPSPDGTPKAASPTAGEG